nr:hypothetical protein Q903MT_gene3208 [Picea sitchensis]
MNSLLTHFTYLVTLHTRLPAYSPTCPCVNTAPEAPTAADSHQQQAAGGRHGGAPLTSGRHAAHQQHT